MKQTGKKSKRWLLRLGMTAVSLSAGALMVLGGVAGAPGQAQPVDRVAMTPPVSSVYVYDEADLQLRAEDAPYLNQMNYAFALIEEGLVTGDHWRGIKTFETYVKRHPHILPVMAVGGWGADGFSRAAATEEGRRRFAQSAAALMEKHGFYGIDLDWEYPGSAAAGIEASDKDGENLILLVEALRRELDRLTEQDGRKRYLSVALGALPQHTKGVDLKKLGELADQINLMTYDLRGFDKTTGHHAALYPSGDEAEELSGHGAVTYYTAQGIPAEKIMLGAAFYGRCWRQVPGGGDGLGRKAVTSGNKIYSFDELRVIKDDPAWEQHWDEAAQAPYLFDGSSFISFENEASCRAKGQYAAGRGLMGVMAWQYGNDTSGTLLKALHEGLNEGPDTP